MESIISSEITIIDPTSEVLNWCVKELTLENPLFKELEKRGKTEQLYHVSKTISFTRKYGNRIMIPFGCLYAIYPLIKNHKLTVNFNEPHYTALHNRDITMKIKELYPYQKKAITRLLSAKSGVLQAGCGAGKTITGIELIRKIGQKFLWLVAKTDLLNQAYKDFMDLYPDLDIGLITDGEFHIGRDGAISTIQTLVNIDPIMYENEFNILIVDECHRCASEIKKIRMYDKVLRRLKCRYRYGLSATPFRSDTLTKTIFFNLGANPDGSWTPTYIVPKSEIETMEAIYTNYDVHTELNFDILNPDGTIDYNGLISFLSENEDRNLEIVNKISSLVDEGRKIVVLSNRIKHCKTLDEMLVRQGIKSTIVIGSTTDKQRKERLGNPGNWDVLVATTELLKEGIDIKELDTVMMTIPIKDRSSIIQSCGRCERKMEGKKQPLYIFVRDIHIPYCLGAGILHKRYIRCRK